jgi:hypothetical protein
LDLIEGETDRDRQTETDRHRQQLKTNKDRQAKTDRQRQTQRQTDSETDRLRDRQRQTDRDPEARALGLREDESAHASTRGPASVFNRHAPVRPVLRVPERERERREREVEGGREGG